MAPVAILRTYIFAIFAKKCGTYIPMAGRNHSRPKGISRLATVIAQAGDVVRIDDVMCALEVEREQGAKLLSRWTNQGWLRRIGPGLYVPVQLEMIDVDQVVTDPWLLVPPLFDPAYIGGRTAAEYWDLTEQIFKDVVVYTARPVRRKNVRSQGITFTLKHLSVDLIFGTTKVWRSRTRIAVADVHRTIIDMLDDPAVGGGIQHVEDCFRQYLNRSDSDPARLISYADRLGNGAVFKRLGFLADRHPAGRPIADAAAGRLTTGHAKLDSALDCSRLITRWRLRVPPAWTK